MDEKTKDLLMKGAIGILIAGALIGGCSYINKKLGLPDDHILEEAVEDHIQDKTGLDIDLSHETPENLT